MFKEDCFTKRHISWSLEDLGAQLLFGKSYFKEHKFKPKEKIGNRKLDFLRYCLSKNKLVVASTNRQISVLTDNEKKDNIPIPVNHTVCFREIVEQGADTNFPDGYIEVIDLSDTNKVATIQGDIIAESVMSDEEDANVLSYYLKNKEVLEETLYA